MTEVKCTDGNCKHNKDGKCKAKKVSYVAAYGYDGGHGCCETKKH